MDRSTLYPIADRWGLADLPNPKRADIRARWTGEKRPPKVGEWFLSGAIVEAYQARGNHRDDAHIAELVVTEPIRQVLGTVEQYLEQHPCEYSFGVHGCVRPVGHVGPHACDEECDLGHLREDELQS